MTIMKMLIGKQLGRNRSSENKTSSNSNNSGGRKNSFGGGGGDFAGHPLLSANLAKSPISPNDNNTMISHKGNEYPSTSPPTPFLPQAGNYPTFFIKDFLLIFIITIG
jgi:hypothetical protein